MHQGAALHFVADMAASGVCLDEAALFQSEFGSQCSRFRGQQMRYLFLRPQHPESALFR
jgi:hypothetical protein